MTWNTYTTILSPEQSDQLTTTNDNVSDVYTDVVEILGESNASEFWFGSDPSPIGEASIATQSSMTAFQINAGNDDYGDWVQIIGSDDTPIMSNTDDFHVHDYIVTDWQRNNKLHKIQVSFSDTGDGGIAVGAYTESLWYSPAVTGISTPVEIGSSKFANGTKVWARVWIDGQVSGTFDFLFGLHIHKIHTHE